MFGGPSRNPVALNQTPARPRPQLDSLGGPPPLSPVAISPLSGLDISDWVLYDPRPDHGSVPEWSKGSDCKSDGVSLRWFKSSRYHFPCRCGGDCRFQPVTGASENSIITRNAAGVTQLIECQPSKLNVEGLNPFARFVNKPPATAGGLFFCINHPIYQRDSNTRELPPGCFE